MEVSGRSYQALTQGALNANGFPTVATADKTVFGDFDADERVPAIRTGEGRH